MVEPLVTRGRIAMRRPGQGRIEVIFSQLELGWNRPKQWRRFRYSCHGRSIVAGVNTRLQPTNPVIRRRSGQLGILQTLLEARGVKLRVIEGIEVRRHPTQHPDKPELSGDAVAGETEFYFSCEIEPALGFLLDVTERVSVGNAVCDHIDAAIRCIR